MADKRWQRTASGEYIPIGTLDPIFHKDNRVGGDNRYIKDENGEFHLERMQGENAAVQGANYTPGVDGGVLPNAKAAKTKNIPTQGEPGTKDNPLPSDYNTVANAKPGQYIKNSKGDVVKLTQEHIDWAKNKLSASTAPKAPDSNMQQNLSDASVRAEALLTIWRHLHPEEVAKYNAMSTAELKAGKDNYKQNGPKGR